MVAIRPVNSQGHGSIAHMKIFNARFGAWALLLSLFGSPAGLRAQPTFTNVTATVGLPQVGSGSVAWGDYDNDGRTDLLFGGAIWRNTANGFTNVTDRKSTRLNSSHG